MVRDSSDREKLLRDCWTLVDDGSGDRVINCPAGDEGGDAESCWVS